MDGHVNRFCKEAETVVDIQIQRNKYKKIQKQLGSNNCYGNQN